MYKRITWFLLIAVCGVLLGIFVLIDKEAPDVQDNPGVQEAPSVRVNQKALMQEETCCEIVEDVIEPVVVQSLERNIKDFLGANLLTEKEIIAARVVRIVASQTDDEPVEISLAEIVGSLIGASGDDAPGVAVSIVKAAGVNHRDVVISAIAVAASLGENPAAVRVAVIKSLPEDQKQAVQAIMEMPEKSMDENIRQTVLSAARSFKKLQANWDPLQSKPTRNLFMDSDGGEVPCSRDGDDKQINNKVEE